jgi:hypothetical protein
MFARRGPESAKSIKGLVQAERERLDKQFLRLQIEEVGFAWQMSFADNLASKIT